MSEKIINGEKNKKTVGYSSDNPPELIRVEKLFPAPVAIMTTTEVECPNCECIVEITFPGERATKDNICECGTTIYPMVRIEAVKTVEYRPVVEFKKAK